MIGGAPQWLRKLRTKKQRREAVLDLIFVLLKVFIVGSALGVLAVAVLIVLLLLHMMLGVAR